MKHAPATRAQALKLMADFAPRMGRGYASGRNFDLGPGQHRAVSQLSPFLRRRLVTEAEVIAAALADHGPEQAEKFVQEVLWRGYFKGWLERRPQVWTDYVTGLNHDLEALTRDDTLNTRVETAEAGETGLACFDAWVAELRETGYLHNHARMWFASIWVFTFGLPWRLGADFFYRHLLDGDPASNTCSWRWVAGLHTRGKAYAAQAWNITKFTDGRFVPSDADLDPVVSDLDQTEEPDGLPEVAPLRPVTAPAPGTPTALILTEDDCAVEDFDLAALDIRATATLASSHLRASRPVADMITRFERDALADAAARLDRIAHPMQADTPEGLVQWAQAAGAGQIAMPYVPTGPLHDWMNTARPVLNAHGIAVTEWRRDWDAQIWPHATAGFFKVKKKMPQILHAAGLS